MKPNWYQIADPSKIASPALLVFADRIEHNILMMLETVNGCSNRLQPHVKTYKMSKVIDMQMRHGINKFKCSTIAEAEMTAKCGAKEVLLAMQPVGPQIMRFFELIDWFPKTSFSAIVDNEASIRDLSKYAQIFDTRTALFLDINNGMNRTGVLPDSKAERMYQLISKLPGIWNGGLHVYDGHIHDGDIKERTKHCAEDFKEVNALVDRLESAGFDVPVVIAGGSPSFPVHAKHRHLALSPGTTLLWDWGYSQAYTDMPYQHAACLLTRIVSKPADDLLCLDLGHKAVAAEMPQPRIKLLNIVTYKVVNHSEEHLVISTPEANEWQVGDCLYALPVHICPTVAKYQEAHVVKDGMVDKTWAIEAAVRKINI